jgi:hypothetical protein
VRVLLLTDGGRGDVEPLVGLAVRLRALGAQVRVCAPPDWAERLAQFGVPLVPVGPPVRPLMHGTTPPSVADVPRRAAELIAEQFDKLPAAAEGRDALVAIAVAGTIRTDGATVAASLLLDGQPRNAAVPAVSDRS